MIRDMPWHYPDQLSGLIDFMTKRRPTHIFRPPTQIFLVDEACFESMYPGYTWTVAAPDCVLGIAKNQRA